MEQIPEEGKLVETGTFRVDAGRMLAVLAKYQLETPLHALRELVRCAVLSGAPKLQLSRAKGAEGTGFTVKFAGRPFSREELADIYAPLLAGDQGPGRHLAAAVLALSGTRPSRLALTCGPAAVELAGPKLTSGPESDGHTSLLALWETEPPNLRLQAVMAFPFESESALACCPIGVRSEQTEVRGFARRDNSGWGLAFEEPGRRGLLSPLREDGSAPLTGSVPSAVSTVSVHAAGVYAETVKMELSCAPVVAEIGDDALLLDASLSGCVRDERFAALRPLLEEKAFLLLKKEAARQEMSFHAVSRLIAKADFRQLWRERMKGEALEEDAGLGPEPGLLGKLLRYLTADDSGSAAKEFPRLASESQLRLLDETARRTWWLQDACRRALRGSLKEDGSREAVLLRGVPVIFSTLGDTLCLDQVRKRRQGGGLKVMKEYDTERSSDGRHPKDAVWLASDRDREFLAAFVPPGEWLD